jgi:hypothetical protein
LREPDVVEVEMVSATSDEPFDVAAVAQSSRAEGPTTLVRVGCNLYKWGSPCLTWSDQNQLEAPPIFVLDDTEEHWYWDRLQAGFQGFNKTLSSMLSTLHNDIGLAGYVRQVGWMLIVWFFPHFL